MTEEARLTRYDTDSFVYGGVHDDTSRIARLWNDRSQVSNLFIVPALVIDLPLSALGDTVTLPLTMLGQLSRDISDYYFPRVGVRPERPLDVVAENSHGM